MQQHLRAPLAECESSIIANSPAVELPPVQFEKYSNSPGAKRRFGFEGKAMFQG